MDQDKLVKLYEVEFFGLARKLLMELADIDRLSPKNPAVIGAVLALGCGAYRDVLGDFDCSHEYPWTCERCPIVTFGVREEGRRELLEAKGVQPPCPFCTGDKTDVELTRSLDLESRQQVTKYKMCCTDCGATGPYKLNAEAARQAWNRRNDPGNCRHTEKGAANA